MRTRTAVPTARAPPRAQEADSRRLAAPAAAQPQASWKWVGHSYRLTQGRYRWFAWAGFGRRSAARYKLLGSAYFVVSH